MSDQYRILIGKLIKVMEFSAKKKKKNRNTALAEKHKHIKNYIPLKNIKENRDR